MIEIRHKETGKVIHTVDGDTLQGANLSVAFLNGADLSGIDLSGADMLGAFLIDANLSGANLTNSKMNSSHLSNADLSNADLSGVSLTTADLSGANLSGANLSGIELTGTNLHGTNLSNTNLSNVELWYTNLTRCVTLHLAQGLETIVHKAPSSLDARTLRACVNHLPDVFLQGVGYNLEEIENLRALYAEDSHTPVENEHWSITLSLVVPYAFRVPCEQYLMYFVQFLRNFDVEVNAELKHSAREVLFTITPTDERQALKTISDALNIYLNMSAASESGSMSVERDLEFSTLIMTPGIRTVV